MTKRVFDIALSIIGIIVLLPLYVVVFLAIKLDSDGPALFRQIRVGRHGRHFRIHKFRTMSVSQDGQASQITVGRDPRITRIGHVLRRTKIDELPQLFDVLRGKMSFVGPRPEVPVYVEHYPPDIRALVLSVRPGITDLASLEFIDEAELIATSPDPNKFYIETLLPRKLEYHVSYVRERSLLHDLRIISHTVFAAAFRR